MKAGQEIKIYKDMILLYARFLNTPGIKKSIK